MSRSLYDPNYIASAKPRGLLSSRLLTAAVSCILLHVASSAGARADETAVMFNRDIRPILAENCFHCHGPDKNHRKADLRLDDRQTATELGAIVPGEPGSSELIHRIESENPDEQMPPAESGRRLTDEQKNLLRRWIAEGAVYQRHWAYEPPVRPEVAGSGHPIDVLVAKQLSRLSLNPSPEADRRTLIRRLSFDLLGLPPRPEEVDAFVNDSAADVYEQLVERLLSSPHFGERMAEGWLDVVRYADTIGYHSDNPRSVWPYRDYVIKAFNENKRFDQFEIEQLAGDLLPDNTEEQRVASCFNRLLLTTQEGGAQPKDYEARMLADRVRAIGTVWLGQTFGCCQCHDHKFDPISTRDFYSLGAFFADIDDKSGDPGTALPNADQAPELARLQGEAAALRQQYDVALSPKLIAAELAWESAVVAELADANRWQALIPAEVSATQGTKLSSDNTGLVSVDAKAARDADTFVFKVTTPLKDVTGSAP